MRKLKMFLVVLAWFLGIQAFASSGEIKFEDFLLRDTSRVIHGSLANGFQYYIVKKEGDRFEMSLLQKSGAHDDGETLEISHMLEHMLATGNRQIATGDTLGNYLKILGLKYGINFNAFTTANCMRYALSWLKSDRAYADSCMEILADIAGGASLCDKDLEKERSRLLNEVYDRKYVLTCRLIDSGEAVYRRGYSLDHWREMRLSSAKKITLSQLDAFYRKWYHPQNQCLVVSGNIPDGIEDMIKRKFGSHPRIPTPAQTNLEMDKGDMIIERHGRAECAITLDVIQPLMTQSDKENPSLFRNYFALRKSSQALGEKLAKRYNDHLKTFVGYMLEDQIAMQLTFVNSLNEEEPDGGIKTLIDSVTVFLDDVMRNGVKITMPKDTLDINELAQRSAQAKQKLQEGDGKGNTIDTNFQPDRCFMYSLPIYKLEDTDAYFTYELSGQDISDYCRKFVNESMLKIECRLPYGYPEKEITEKLNALLAHKAQAGDVKFEDFIVTDSSNISQGVLANGFRYYICNNGRPNNGMEMRLIQKSGADDDGGTPGIALLLRRMLFSEKQTSLPIGSDYRSEIDHECTEFNLFRLKNEPAYVDSCMCLLAQIAGRARFSASELERQKQLLVNEITNRRYDFAKSEEDCLKAAFLEGLTPEEWESRQIESVRSITLRQLKSYYRQWYVPENQCLYVFGNAPANVVDMIKRRFGSRPSGPAPERNANELSNQRVLMVNNDNATFAVRFLFIKPRVATSAKANLDYLRKMTMYNHFGLSYSFYNSGLVALSMNENDKILDRPVFELSYKKGVDLYADANQINDFIADAKTKLEEIMHNGVPAHVAPLPIEQRKELQQQALFDARKWVVLDTHSCIKASFVNSAPLIKDFMANNYFLHELSEQDIQDFSKELFSDYDLRVVCTIPYGYPDAGIKSKLEAVLSEIGK